jgi:hypothetical protein
MKCVVCECDLGELEGARHQQKPSLTLGQQLLFLNFITRSLILWLLYVN